MSAHLALGRDAGFGGATGERADAGGLVVGGGVDDGGGAGIAGPARRSRPKAGGGGCRGGHAQTVAYERRRCKLATPRYLK